jgi:hypothetical protein
LEASRSGENKVMIIRPLLFTSLAAAAAGLSDPAAAQAQSTGSASIVSSGGVNLLRSQSGQQSAAFGTVTFVLDTQLNGSLTVQLLGFVASGPESSRVVLSGAETSQVLTGTSMASDALSLSFSAGAGLDLKQSESRSSSSVRVFLAQYN